ncbi:multidrug resistance protein [Aspergillus arachidicola]|uniref:Multidrug resistance protein n=1 Tax=Aspergillus arachidicola TaxID=656916 RepID=A0A2G7G6D1_9EURO|nr:multidrug resistance protein [Aspergillus arachidicola]
MMVEYMWLAKVSALCSLLFVIYTPLGLWRRRGAAIKVVFPSLSGRLKLALGIGFSAIQLLYLLNSTRVTTSHQGLLPAVASFLAALGLCMLSYVEHYRNVQPSSAVIIYLTLSLVKDFICIPLLFRQSVSHEFPLVIIRVVVELPLLATESCSKTGILQERYRHLPPETVTGILGRATFWWINSILKAGYDAALTQTELPSLDRPLSSKSLRRRIIRAWGGRSRNKAYFADCPCKVFPKGILAPVIPRLFLILFRYSQPILMGITIQFVQDKASLGEQTSAGYWIVILTIMIYSGLAIATSLYQHRLNRLQVMTRGALVGLIHARCFRVVKPNMQDGKVLALITADVDNVIGVAEMWHETWAQTIEVMVGTALLVKKIGWFAGIPLIMVIGCSRLSAYVAKHIQGRQADWSTATQARLATITSVLAGAKSVKMLGLEDAISSLISELRSREISLSKKMRWIMVAYNASANALGIFSPALTLSIFAIFRGLDYPLDAGTVFTSIALLTMVTHPANMVMTIIPRAVASLANFRRIQEYLTEKQLLDERHGLPQKPKDVGDADNDRTSAMVLEHVDICLSDESCPLLLDINLKVNQGSILICTGPVGTGKSILASALLGETRSARGRICLPDEQIAFCNQIPWLPNASIRDVICGGSRVIDYTWYQTVLDACCLSVDLETLKDPDGSQTCITNNGINLSGGQKSRIALARAVYSRSRIVILDDPFSSLDGGVKKHIIGALLGPGGLFRIMQTTVFLITAEDTYLNIADQVIVLNNNHVQRLSPEDVSAYEGTQASDTQATANKDHDDQMSDRFKVQADKMRMTDAADDLARRIGDIAVYRYYFNSVGICNILLMTSCTAVYAFCLTFSQNVLRWWTDSGSAGSRGYLLLYFVASWAAWLATNGTMWSTHILIAPRSGFTLHSRLLSKILNAPLSYFSSAEAGTILNRFGQDIQLVDKQLPAAFANLSNQIFKLLMQAIVLFTVQPVMASTLPFCAICIYFIQRIYLRTSRQLRFIDLESRSELYTNIVETVEGVDTIRAFGWESRFEYSNIIKLDKSQGTMYLLLCLQRWLNVVLDLLITAIAVILIAFAITFRESATGGQVGVALNMIIAANTTLLRSVESWTSLETSLGSVARLKSVEEDTPVEKSSRDVLEPRLEWPTKGTITIRGLSAGYKSQTPILRDVTLEVPAGQNITIRGRTGSGKSTFILALLQLLDKQDGLIEVDNMDLARLPLRIVRQRCFVSIPQEPFILPSASIRFNLDPYGQHDSTAIWKTLIKTNLWSHFSSPVGQGTTMTVARDALDKTLSDFPPLSTGQRQIFASAQALLRARSAISCYECSLDGRRPILLLDEPSASLDEVTASSMQQIMEEFTSRGHTVITITHGMKAFQNQGREGSDRVLRMEDGRLIQTST